MRDRIEYQSGPTVSQRAPLYIDVSKDPRARNPAYLNLYASRIGTTVIPVNSTDGTLFTGRSAFNAGGGGGGANNISNSNQDGVDIINIIRNIKYDLVTNLQASWQGDELLITWDFDTTANNNGFATDFSILFSFAVGNPIEYKYSTINKTDSSQSLKITVALNQYIFGEPTDSFVTIGVAAEDGNLNKGEYATISAPIHNIQLTAPTIIVTSILNGYSVNVTNINDQVAGVLNYISIEEYVSNNNTEPTGVTYRQVYLGNKSINPITVLTPTTEKRWVKARFTSGFGSYGPYSTGYSVTPTSPVSIDLVPPNEVTNVTASWSGDNIVINYTLPTTDPGTRFIAQLTAPNSSVAYFYIYPSGSGTSQTATINKSDLNNQFGDLYSSFSGIFKSVDSSDNRSSGVSFSVATRTNPLVGVTPTPTVTAISNGYSASWTLSSGATYAEVYQKATTWGSTNLPVDYYTGTASSGTSGTNTLVINTVKDDDNNSVSTIPTGYFIVGTGIPNNTFVSSVSGSGTLTLTLSTYDSSGNVIASNLTTTASGTYTLTSMVYSGTGPATIPMPIYGNIYIIVRYYDDWHNYSNVSTETVIKPLNPAIVDSSVPNAPTLTSTAQGNNTITISIGTTDASTKGYRIRYKKSTDTLYTTDIIAPVSVFSGGSSTTSYTINNLTSGTTYNISGAGYNQYNGVGSYSTDINISTATPTVSVPTSIVLTSQSYGFLASWTAPSSPTTPVSQYKVELYNSANTLLATYYTFSTNYSFTGLSASTTYYIKVYTQDVYGKLSAAVTSSNITLNAAGGVTSGSAPSSSPDPTVKGLFGALQVTWTAISNPDPVTYEVHISTTNGFTPASGTKYLETQGTFAVIKNLPDGTALSYATTYYVKIVAKDFDGSASASTQASASPSQIDNGDIAANAIRANVIQSGTITSTEINSNNLLVGKIFAVGAGAGDTSPIKIDASGNVTKLYSGTGVYNNSNTPFYLDTLGKFSLKDRLTFDGNSTLTVQGTINASGGTFTGSVTAGNMKFGVNANSTNTGMYINANNYWYDTGNFSAGGSNDRITWDGTNFNVTGGISAQRGSLSGPLLFGSNGYLLLGTSATISTVSADGTYITYTTSASHGFTAGKKVSVTGIMPGAFNLDRATIFDTPTTTTFRVANASTGTYQYGGIAIMTDYGNRMQIDKGTITAYDSTGTTFTTQIVGDGSSAYTFYTTKASIGSWTVDSSKLYAGSGSSNVGLASSGTYAIFAGATDNSGTSAKFSVTHAGAVTASNMQITGGTLDVGAASPNGFHVNTSGNLTTSNAIISGNITATSGKITGSFQVDTGGQFYVGNGSTSTVAITPSGLAAFNSSGAALTEILTSSISSGSTPRGNSIGSAPFEINLFSKGALIGGWFMNDQKIQSRSGEFTLDSSNKLIQILGSIGTQYAVKLGTGAYNSGTGTYNVFEAGAPDINNNITSPNFYITKDGTMTANNGNFSGTITGSEFTLKTYGSTNYWTSNAFNAGSASTFLNISASTGTILAYSQSTQDEINEGGSITYPDGSGGNSTTGITNIPQQLQVDTQSIKIQGIPGNGNNLTYLGTLEYGGSGSPNEYITQYRAQGYSRAGNEPSWAYGRAARYRTIIADPYDYNKLKRGFGIYYGTRTSNPGASSGFVGDIWISW